MSQSSAALEAPLPNRPVSRAVLHAVPAPTPDASAVLGETVDQAVELLSADAAIVLGSGGEVTAWQVAAQAGADADAAELRERVEAVLARQSGRFRRPLPTQPDHGDAGNAIACILVVPLRSAPGVLAVGARQGRAFSDRDRTLLELMADKAAAAMENARLQSAQQAMADELDRRGADAERARAAHDELLRVALSGAGVSAMIAALARAVHAPLALTSAAGVRIAAAGADAGDVERLWEARAADATFVRDLADVIQNGHPRHHAIAAATGPWRIRELAAGDDILGALVVLDAPGLSESDIAILEEGRAVLAAELLRDLRVLDAEVRLHGGLLETLIGAGDVETVETRAALLGIDVDAPQCVLAIGRGASGELGLPLAITSGQAASARVGVRSVLAQRDHTIVVLLVSGDRCVSRQVVEDWVEAFKVQLAQRGADLPAGIGVSSIPVPRAAIGAGVAAAQQALRVGQVCCAGEVAFVQDVELLAVFADSMKQEQLKGCVEHCIGDLLAYDARTNSELVRTLEVYLDHSCVARHAAAALFLHPHSLRYRLRRIEEVQRLDLQDPVARLTAHLATKVRSLFEGAPATA